MDFAEASGKTVEEAIEKALKELGVTREDVSVHVISEGKQGLFGMKGEKMAKVKVVPKE